MIKFSYHNQLAKISAFILSLTFIFLVSAISQKSASGQATCTSQCLPTDPKRCQSTSVYYCGNCDDDRYNDWCFETDCSLIGTQCLNGACGSTCPNAICNAAGGECSSCPLDCRTATACCAINGVCGPGETAQNCPADCCDLDHDTYQSALCGGQDCDDAQNNIHPGAVENCDTIDNNCNSQADEGCDTDGDRFCAIDRRLYNNNSMCPLTPFSADGDLGNDCQDHNSQINPAVSENCADGIDNNCGGGIDCLDSSCAASPSCCTPNWICSAWSACTGTTVTRACNDANACTSPGNAPPSSAACLGASITYPVSNQQIVRGQDMAFQGAAIGGTSPFNIRWIHSSSQVGAFASVLNGSADTLNWPNGSAVISLNIMDAVGQSATATVPVEVFPVGTFTAEIQAYRNSFDRTQGTPANFYVNVIGGEGALTFEWRNNDGVFSTSQYVSADVSSWSLGTHNVTVTVRDSSGHTATDSEPITITQMTATIMPPNNTTVQAGVDIFFSVSVSGGSAPYSCSWFSSLNGLISSNCAFTRNDLDQGTHVITAIVRDSSTPQITATATINLIITPADPLAVSIIAPAENSAFTQGELIDFAASVSGGILPYASFSWTTSAGATLASGNTDYSDSSALSFSYSALPIGNQAVTLTVRDAIGTMRAATVNLAITAPPALSAAIASPGTNSAFEQYTDTINFQGVATGGIGPYSYGWNSSLSGSIGTGQTFTRNDLAAGTHAITLTISDSAGHTDSAVISIIITPSIDVNAVKDMTRYTAKETFLIPHSVWQDALALVPVTTWNQNGTITHYPSLIFYQESATISDVDSAIHFLQLYGPSRVTAVGSISPAVGNLLIAANPTGAGLSASQVSQITAQDYFSYWTLYDTVVIADYASYEAGLTASLLASSYNVPLIFISSANFSANQPFLSGKKAVIVGSMDSALLSQINSATVSQTPLSVVTAQTLYATKTGARGLVLVNPNDLNINVNQTFTPEKGTGQITRLLGSMSMAAPFLAAANREIIGAISLSDTGANNSCSANSAITGNISSAIAAASSLRNHLFSSPPSHLTVVAQPRAIPESRYASCNGTGQQIRTVADWQYGTDSAAFNTEPRATVGRIYGLSVTDASAQIARTIFYRSIVNSRYGSINSSLSIGHSSANACNSAVRVFSNTQTAGFNSACYTNCSNAGCTNSVQPPFASPSSAYALKKIISYSDGGGANTWTYTLSYSNIQFSQALDVPIIVAEAPNTANFWQSVIMNVMSIRLSRTGAVAYIGSPSATPINSYFVNHAVLGSLGANQNNTVGSAFYSIPPTLGSAFLLIGSPALAPALPHINWN